jgi:hypothetical protein
MATALDLTRSRAALAALDAAWDTFEGAPDLTTLGALEAAELATVDAFRADTADRNDPAAITVFDLPFIRRLCAAE